MSDIKIYQATPQKLIRQIHFWIFHLLKVCFQAILLKMDTNLVSCALNMNITWLHPKCVNNGDFSWD